MKINIGKVGSIFRFLLVIKNGEVNLLWLIEKVRYNKVNKQDIMCDQQNKKSSKRWLWLNYSNAQFDKRVWSKAKGKYHFCLQIPKIIELDTAYLGKKLFGRVNLTGLFNKDYHVYSTHDGVTCDSSCMD